jgi:hypothetical protein
MVTVFLSWVRGRSGVDGQGDDLGAAIVRVGLRLAEAGESVTPEAIHDALQAEGFDPPSPKAIRERAQVLLRARVARDN